MKSGYFVHEVAFAKQPKLKKREMKKILMLITAFVFGNGMLGILPMASAQELSTRSNQQDTTAVASSENMTLIASIKADSAFQSHCVEGLRAAIEASREARNQRIENERRAAEEVDSLNVAAEEVASVDSNKPFEGKIVKWAGRNRYGKYTSQCAAHANGCLGRAGYYSQGHAYQILSQFPSVINGYKHVKIPNLSTVSADKRFATVLEMHREAADYVKENLDISKLVRGKYYVVNMYYRTSPYMLQFFYSARKQGTGNYGTHVGVLYYSTEYKTWVVEHNIHGNVYYDPLLSILGGLSNPHSYGVTSISRVSR